MCEHGMDGYSLPQVHDRILQRPNAKSPWSQVYSTMDKLVGSVFQLFDCQEADFTPNSFSYILREV